MYSDKINKKEDESVRAHKTMVVNLYGGPATGKSVTAAMLYAMLSTSHRYGTVEPISEYAKQLAWKINKNPNSEESRKAKELISNQIHVTSIQAERVTNVCDQADIIVNDSPIRIGKIYYNHHMKKSGKSNTREFEYTKDQLEKIITEAEKEYEEVNIFLERSDEVAFQKKGRVHNEEESKHIDKMIKNMLKEDDIPFIEITNKMDIASVIGEIEKHIVHRSIQKMELLEDEKIHKEISKSDIEGIQSILEKNGSGYSEPSPGDGPSRA